MVSAQLRTRNDLTVATMRTKLLVDQLGLEKVKDTVIGNELARGISGGERKRVSIGVEMMSNPRILFVDEPTSGLDGYQAFEVMKYLKHICQLEQIVVITTIHQPRSSIFAMLDSLLLLREGKCVYQDSPCGVIKYFSSLGFDCPDLYNPADFVIDVISNPSVVVDFAQLWRDTEAAASNGVKLILSNSSSPALEVTREICPSGGHSLVVDAMQKKSRTQWPSLEMIRVIVWRSVVCVWRSRRLVVSRFILTTLLGLIAGGLYHNMGDGQQSIRDRVGFLFVATFIQFTGAFNIAIFHYPSERTILRRFSLHLHLL